jgi:hypothetical protein
MVKIFDVVYTHKNDICVVLITDLDVPYHHDGIASDAAFIPLDIQNPEEWKQTFKACVCFDLVNQDYKIISTAQLKVFDGEVTDGYIPYDKGTSKIRSILGLIKLADKWYGSPPKDKTLAKHLKKYDRKTNKAGR